MTRSIGLTGQAPGAADNRCRPEVPRAEVFRSAMREVLASVNVHLGYLVPVGHPARPRQSAIERSATCAQRTAVMPSTPPVSPPAVLTRGDGPPEPPAVPTRGGDPPEPPPARAARRDLF